ncbi:MAG: family 78 glycoside hydrolase catalytic domain [Anaerolineales bacterium]
MTTDQKHLLTILLGVAMGILLSVLFWANPAFSATLSAWIPIPQRPLPAQSAPVHSPALELVPTQTLSQPVTLLPTLPESPVPLPTATTAPLPTPVLVQTLPPTDPTLLARSYPETFVLVPPIWAHADPPGAHEIVLFRHTFEVTEPTSLAELQIFADTRYEIWLDGKWIGRGPARFSCTLREYDIYPIDTLTPGSHQIAVLVQWAPNTRRSESNTPLLQARIQTYTPAGPLPLLQTGPDWKVFATSAWNLHAGLIHSWELIGPMEWLDFRALPQNWYTPGFPDFTWAKAVPVSLFANAAQNPTLASRVCAARDIPLPFIPAYQPRTIPLLTNLPLTPALAETGQLSPNRITIQPNLTENTASFTFNIIKPIVFTVEFLGVSSSVRITDTVQLDNLPLRWVPAGATRPDVWVGRLLVQPGLHTLTHRNLRAFPIFDVFTDGLQMTPPVIFPGHPGHRMLLSEPVANPQGFTPLAGPGLSIRVDQTPAYLILELPQIVHGRLSAEVLGPPGTIIDIGWDERKYQNTRPLPFPGLLHPQWSQVDSWILDGNTRELTTLDSRTGRYLVINIWGSGPVELRNLRVLEERYPTTPRGELTTTNPRLDQIWQIGVHTAQINMFDAYADPWRERGQWWGDAYITDRTNRVAFGETALLRRGLLYMADGLEDGVLTAYAPGGHGIHTLDYGMLWVQSLEAYYTLTEDHPLLAEVYPTLQTFMAHLQKKTSGGLLNIPRAHWSQSTYLDPRATLSRYGQSTAVNAIYYGTLQSAANLAEQMADADSAQQWRAQAETLRQQLNTKLYNPTEGRYAATLLFGRLYAPDPFAQAWPLAYDLVPETEVPRVVTALQELLSDHPQNPNLDIYGMNWVLEALARHGYISETLALLDQYYGYLLNAGATTWWETFKAHESYAATYSHGWGSSPTWILSTYLLGGRWTGPDAWAVRPALEGVASASGSIPIGQNQLTISWTVQSCSLINIEIRAPSHTTGELILPFTDAETITLNGVEVLQEGRNLLPELTTQPDGLHLSLTKRPEYRLTVVRPCPN